MTPRSLLARQYARSLRLFPFVMAFGFAATTLLGCNKDKPKAGETKKAEATPIPSGVVFNDFLPTTGSAAGLGVRDSGVEGGLAGVGGDTNEPGAAPGEGDKLVVKVLEPGADPRALRKYTFVANKVDKRVLTLQQGVQQNSGGQTAPAQEVTLRVHVDLTTKQVNPAGATIEAKVTKVELPGAPAQAAQMLASMNGLTGTFDVSSHGEAGEVSFMASSQLRNELAQTVVQGLSQAVQLLLTPLPTVPVGVGAKWELTGGGMEAEAGTRRFTLKEVTNEGAVVETDIDMKVPRRAQQSPRGGTMFIEIDGKGKYTQTIKFNQLAPKAEGELTVNEKIEVPDPKGGKQVVTQVQKSRQIVETPAK